MGVLYHVEYKRPDCSVYLLCLESEGFADETYYETYNEARTRMANEILKDPGFDYRIIKRIITKEVISEMEAEG
jgi:hypothetical protein